ncbi:hemerythrin domain-containing protein [Halosquirtibacter xylanolyticus]|uniref:hemerythrin domain-containing protein n=1 Tax=Halosquirtibacter xylanolyticus TaxID=3374599 RepID=UPI0037483090|nr:hemerythrin domain-containing protein [Prolixibacteraceae bacterium]
MNNLDIHKWENRRMCDILLKYPRVLSLLDRLHIHLELHEMTVKEVCDQTNTNLTLFVILIESFLDKSENFNGKYDLSIIPDLVAYLRESHNYFLEKKIPYLNQILAQFIEKFKHPQIGLLKIFFDEYCQEVQQHMSYEDREVFPYINKLHKLSVEKDITHLDFSMEEFEEHHTNIEEKLSDLKNLLIKHFASDYGNFLKTQFLLNLYDLEDEIHDHSRLEDDILIPLVKQLETLTSNER